jgi:hypothetical protein
MEPSDDVFDTHLISPLARRPTKVTAAQQMKMQMKNALARVSAGINDNAETVFGNTLLARQFCGHKKNLNNNGLVVRLQIQNRGDMLARHDQYMDRGLGTDVPEGDYGLVSVNDITFDSALNNPTEKTIAHQLSLSELLERSFLVTSTRALDEDLFTLYLEGHTLERGTDAGPPDTLPRRRLEGRTVISAHNIAAIDSKKLVIHPVQRNANMGAPVQVGV